MNFLPLLTFLSHLSLGIEEENLSWFEAKQIILKM